MGASSLQKDAKSLGLVLEPIHQHFGVIVQGLDLSQPLSEQQQALLIAALDEYDALLFRGQALSPADEQRTLQYFPHDEKAVEEQRWANAFMQLRAPGSPLVAVRPNNVALKDHFGLTTDDYAKGNCNGVISKGHVWHIDVHDNPCLPEVISIYSHKTPSSGSDTLFAYTPSFLAALPSEELEHLESLQISSLRQSLPMRFRFPVPMNFEGTERTDDVEGKIADAERTGELGEPKWMPLVVSNPRNGRKSMLLAPHQTYRIGDLSPKDSRQFAKQLMERASASEHHYRHAWQDKDFFIWANRSFIHTGTPQDDYQQQERLFHLIWLNSCNPVQPANPLVAVTA